MRLMRLTLSAPMQSWGVDSKWDHRETSLMPTKSAIVGLLGCCLGYPRGDERLNELDDQLHLAVRADRPGRIMTDFHTVQGTDGVILNAAGKNRGETIITPRQYLQGAVFTVFLWGDEEALTRCERALRHPKWAPYLGRKSCVPSVPLLPVWVEAESVDEAVRRCAFDPDSRLLPVEIEMLPGDELRQDERMLKRMDKIRRADLNEYVPRRIRASYVHMGGEAL